MSAILSNLKDFSRSLVVTYTNIPEACIDLHYWSTLVGVWGYYTRVGVVLFSKKDIKLSFT